MSQVNAINSFGNGNLETKAQLQIFKRCGFENYLAKMETYLTPKLK